LQGNRQVRDVVLLARLFRSPEAGRTENRFRPIV
jgi:hypothetical protein